MMDIRPLIHFWINKPDSYDDGEDHQTARMGIRTYSQVRGLEDMYGRCVSPTTLITWGNPNKMVDLWMDLDTMVGDMESEDFLELRFYLLAVNGEDDWDLWPTPPRNLRQAFENMAKKLFM